MSTFPTKNPATNETLAEYTRMSQDEALAIVKASNTAQRDWAAMSVSDRLPYFQKLANVLRDNSEQWARLMSQEMGKPIKECRYEIATKCAGLADFIVERGEDWLADQMLDGDGVKHLVRFEALGTLFLIMPWNYPFWQPIKVALWPLAAGNSIVLKHASNVTGSALAVEEAFRLAGFPEDLFRTVVIRHDVMPAIMASPYVHAGSLTGSEKAGSIFAAEAGKHLKKVVLELGGSDPLIVLDDADIAKAAAGAVKGRMSNTGQVCTASKRIIVLESIAEAFTQAFVDAVKNLKVGNPLEDDTDVGPMVNTRAVEEMEAFVADAVEKGGVVAAGGKRVEGPGNFFEPTVITNTTPDMNICYQEVFGPVAPIIIAKDEAEAIRIANDSEYGLSSTVWSTNLERAQRVAAKLNTGAVFINSISKSDPRIPIGGIKKSGYGRELSPFGAREFVNIKGVNVYSS